MRKVKEWVFPIKTICELNYSGHWSKTYKRRKNQKYIVFYEWKNDPPPPLKFPLHIVLTRLTPRLLEEGDNLPSAFKAIKDIIADLIFPGLPHGKADSDKRLTWEYKQEKAKGYNVKIQFYLADSLDDC